MTLNDPDTIKRATRLRRMMNEFITTMTPQERDRIMQVHLAQARGPLRNTVLLFEMTAMLLRARQTARPMEEQNVSELHP